jgi:teichuronic acid biosynthesis glycosyltransferase TuaG
MDLVSIIIPVYNIIFFREAFNSAYNQSYKKKEIIIIYDNNKKEDLEIINKIIYKKKNTKLINNKKNLGAGISRNIGIKYSKGSYIAFLDADDLWSRKKLAVQINFMKKNYVNFCHTTYRIIDKSGKFLNYRRAKKILNYKYLLKSCDIGLSTVIVKKNFLKDNKFPKLKTKEDYVFWLKLLKQENIYGIDKAYTVWRKLDNSLSSSYCQKICDAFKVYNFYERFSVIQSVFMVLRLSYFYLIKNLSK